MLSLRSAAELAYRELRRREPENRAEVLDLIALELATHAPIYGAREPSAEVSQIDKALLAQGSFRGGAKRLVIEAEGLTITNLQISRLDFEVALERLTSYGEAA